MRKFACRFFSLLALSAAFATIPAAFGQSSTSGTVVGIVTDQSHAIIPKAEVRLLNNETNAEQTQMTNESGQYTFVNVAPGTYKLTTSKTGFRNSTTTGIIVDVNRSSNVPVVLEVGAATQVVEVVAESTAQLQTQDAQIGNVVRTDEILRLPSLQRNVTELLGLQPGVVPTASGTGTGLQLRVTGAIEDQNTVTVDGIDITQSVIAAGTVVPTPTDSVEEFKVNVANPNSSLDRGSGGQMTLVGRHGTNTIHGSLYEYLQNSALNSNTWDNNHAGLAKPGIRDNRFGVSLGGPIIKNKTFIFGNYEGRRFGQVAQVTRTVPTDTLKQGILRFANANGTIQSFNLATASVCGPTGTQACDPRGLGISPAVKQQLSLMPSGNVVGGDGLNTTGYLANISAPINTDYGVVRLDHNFSDKLQFNGSYTYFRNITTGTGDIEILNGKPQSVVLTPQRGMVLSSGVTWSIRPDLLNAFHFGYVRDVNANQATSPTAAATILGIPGTTSSAGPVALVVGSGVTAGIDSPIDMDTQRARFQSNVNKDFQFLDDMTWIKASHTVQFGGQFHILPYTHVRADKVLGSISSLVANADVAGASGSSASYLNLVAANRPPTCGAAVTSNCITSNNLLNWDRFYASTLGLIDNVNVLAVRDASLNPLPFNTPLVNKTNEFATYMYLQDTWRITKSFTVTYGLSYGWQTAPTEQLSRQTVEIDATSGQILNASTFLQNKLNAAAAGQVYNPTIGWVPVKQAHVPVYNIDWGDVAPRASFAWNPKFDTGLLGRLFGSSSVLRGGFSMVYDRSNTVQSVEIPMLGVGFGQSITIASPACNATTAGGPGCNAAAGVNSNPGLASFRVGVDGPLPLPTVPAVSVPVVPSTPFGEALSFQVDPNTKIGRSYNVDLSFQHEFKGGIVFEAAYVGRFGRKLPQAVNFTQSPYMFKDSASGQTFAQAYDAVATALRNQQPVATQPWFENQLPGITTKNNVTGTATAYVASRNTSNFINGNVSSLFQNLGTYRRQIGLVPYNNDEAQMEFMRTYIGETNYNGLLLNVNKRLSRGLQVSANYTYSKSLDDDLQWQNNASFYPNSFHPGAEYGPSLYNRKHVFTAYYVYDLPAGQGHMLSTHNWFDRVIGGWYTSGIITMFSGQPQWVAEGSQVWGDAIILGSNSDLIGTNGVPSTGLNSNVAGSGGVGTNAALKTGSGLNLFSNPQAVFSSFRPVLLSQDTTDGRGNPFWGLPFRNFDVSLGKTTKITEKINTRFSADFFNILNHPNFANPSLSYTNPAAFGVITGTFQPPNRTNSARWIELGLRVQF